MVVIVPGSTLCWCKVVRWVNCSLPMSTHRAVDDLLVQYF